SPARAQQRGPVGSEAEERGVAERDLAGVAAGEVPGGGAGAPHQDQHEAVDQEGVADDQRDESRCDEERDGGRQAPHAPRASAPRWPKSPAGRAIRMPMNSKRYRTSFQAVPTTYEPPTSTAATISAAISAPSMSPRPPRTTAT